MEDREIIELFFNRSEQAIAELSRKYGALCRRIAFHILNNREDAEECVNDAFLGVWNRIPPETPDPLGAYVCRITKNISLKKYRYNTTQKRNSAYDISLSELEDCIPDLKKEADVSSEKELSILINAFLESLHKKSRIMFVKRYWFGESIRDIAAEFGMTENNTTVKLLRIRKKLKEYLEKEGVVL